jgi:hypothetical protein
MFEYLKLKFEISMWSVWNLKIEMSKFGCVTTESWNLKFEISLWNVSKKIENLKTKSWILKSLNIKIEIEMSKY